MLSPNPMRRLVLLLLYSRVIHRDGHGFSWQSPLHNTARPDVPYISWSPDQFYHRVPPSLRRICITDHIRGIKSKKTCQSIPIGLHRLSSILRLAKLANDKRTEKGLYAQASFAKRTSGYTRIIPLPRRKGDDAKMARFEWVDQKPEPIKKKTARKKESTVSKGKIKVTRK